MSVNGSLFGRSFLLATVASVVLFAQATGSGSGAGSGAGGGSTGGSTGAPGGTGGAGATTPGRGTTPSMGQQDPFGRDRYGLDRQMPVFLSGRVMLDDGNPAPPQTVIERVCSGGQPRPEGYTDSKGRFSIQLGNNANVLPDASISGNGDDFGGFMSGSTRQMPGAPPGTRGVSERELMMCEIRASLPGYRSQIVSLAGRRLLDNPDIGTIIMKRLGHVEGLTTSMTSMEAPKEAKKAYEKATNALKKNKPDEARKELERAVELYPRYAAAWFDLGFLNERTGQDEAALKAYEASLKADAKFVKPYIQIAGMQVRLQKWQEASDTADRALKLNPFDYPNVYLFHSVANYNLQKLDVAEKSAREGIKQDDLHRLPKLHHILGVILAQKSEYSDAADSMRSYLKFAPNARDANAVQGQLAEIDKLVAETKTSSTPKP